MNIYLLSSTILAICLYVPLGYQLYTGKAKQNIATWLLWGILDFIVAASIYVQGGSWYLPAACTVLCAAIAVFASQKFWNRIPENA